MEKWAEVRFDFSYAKKEGTYVIRGRRTDSSKIELIAVINEG